MQKLHAGICAVMLLAVVDHNGCFIWADIGAPGSSGDAAVFNASELREKLELGQWLPWHDGCTVGTLRIRPFLIGDTAFPLRSYMMKNFLGDHHDRDSDEYAYNFCHIRCRRLVECAFGILKGRWRLLLAGTMTDPIFLAQTIQACLLLHNVCERESDKFPPNSRWAPEDFNQPALNPQRPLAAVPSAALSQGTTIRDALAQYCKSLF